VATGFQVTITNGVSSSSALSVTVTGTGTVTSNPPGINNCSSGTCVANFTTGASVTLTVMSGKLSGWGGACSGTGACTVSMTANRSVTATFDINPTPTITALSPASVAAGSSAFPLTVTGTGFVAGATATVGGLARTVTVGSATQLTVAVVAADVAVGGAVPVKVTNPAACVGGLCASNAVNLTVTVPPAVPTLSSISPTSVAAGGASFPLTATGTNFVAGSVVQVNGSPRATTLGSATQLTATILAADIATAGPLSLTVFTPAPGGGTSLAKTLTVTPPTGPSLSVSPTTVARGGSVTATWSGIVSPSSTDWIGLYAPGAAESAYLAWIYVSCSQTAGSAKAAGACAFGIPGTLTLGAYELRLFANNSYTRLATSPALTVSP